MHSLAWNWSKRILTSFLNNPQNFLINAKLKPSGPGHFVPSLAFTTVSISSPEKVAVNTKLLSIDKVEG
jgi:hypothetical protein